MALGRSFRLGISTCPNDTFAFHAILEKAIDLEGIDFQIELLDIQDLNAGLQQGRFEVAKASFHAALALADRYWVLPSGSAIGFGVGPLLLASASASREPLSSSIVLCPGADTTATFLYRYFYGQPSQVKQVLFSDIMPRLRDASADFGVCIHEGRFTWQKVGLRLVEDLGTRWEVETGTPLPLGGILASRNIDSKNLDSIQRVIQSSICYAMQFPDRALPTMRRFAQEFDDRVLMQHVSLYVNEWTVELGRVGKNALEAFSRKAIELAHRNPSDFPLPMAPLEIYIPSHGDLAPSTTT